MNKEMTHWSPPDVGALFVVTGPSGCGKTTLIKAAREDIDGIGFSVSATTRGIRQGETNGVDYHFVSTEEFKSKIKADEFLEWAKVYSNYYGTLKSQVHDSLSSGNSILLDIDAQGAEQVRTSEISEVSIFILPPSAEALRERLLKRGTDSNETIERRMREAKVQMNAAVHFDYVVINDDLKSAIFQFKSIIIAELLKVKRRKKWVEQFSK